MNRISASSVPPTMALCGHTNKILVPILLCGIYKKVPNKALQRTPRSLVAERKGSAIGKEMKKIEENYQRITENNRLFDIRFWQSQGDIAIFEAAAEMVNDYFLIRGKNADESRLQRTIETFRKA